MRNMNEMRGRLRPHSDELTDADVQKDRSKRAIRRQNKKRFDKRDAYDR